MFTFSEAQLMAWVSPVFWPFLRVLAVFSSAPIFSARSVPVRTRVALAFLIAFCAQAGLPGQPVIGLNDPGAMGAVLQQVVVGVAIGLAVRIVFSAVELAGEIIGLQMGLNFAGFFDPATGSQATALSRFFGVTVSWVFIVTGGHLLVIAGVVQSLHSFPVGPEPFAFLKTAQPQRWGAEVFATGLWIALPMVAMLLFVNLVMGIAARVAQQLNLFAIGFPITLTVGLVGVLLTLPMMQAPFTMALERMLQHFQ